MKRKTLKDYKAELAQAQERISDLEKRLRKYETKPGEAPARIDGWNVVKSGGYYRLFRKIKGRTQGIYLGKKVDEDLARKKIRKKLAALRKAANNQ